MGSSELELQASSSPLKVIHLHFVSAYYLHQRFNLPSYSRVCKVGNFPVALQSLLYLVCSQVYLS